MPLVSELDLPKIDYTDPTLRGPRFHRAMEDAAGRSWVASSSLGYIVLDREAATFLLRTRAATFPGMRMAEAFGISAGPLYEEMRRNIINVNGDDHRRLRNLVNPAFTPRAADRHRPLLRELLEELFAPLLPPEASRAGAGATRCDFVTAVAAPYPARAIAAVLGAPAEDAGRLAQWSDWVQRQFDVVSLAEERDRIERSVVELTDYIGELLERRRHDPRDDLVSILLAAEADGDRLSDVECVNLVLDVLIGGIDTTQAQLAHAVRLLAEHPEQWQRLRADPDLAARATEEALRFEPITPFTARMTEEDVDCRGVTFPAGTLVLVSAFSGNRDSEAFEAPSEFDLTVERDAKPLTFGAGIHNCLGASLARAELQEALAFMARRVGRLELDGEPEFEGVTGIYGLRSLPLRLEAA